MIAGLPDWEYLAPGSKHCAGCGPMIGLRLLLKSAGQDTIVVMGTGCMEVVTTTYPYTSYLLPFIHNAFENTAATASGIEAALKHLNKENVNVLAIAGDGGCYSDDTEILTENGFKNVKDISIKDNVWSVNRTSNKLEISSIKKAHKYFYDGKMVRVKNRYIDFLVTPNHNMPIFKGGKWQFIKAEDLKERYKTRVLRKFNWKGKGLRYVYVKPTKIVNNQRVFVRFDTKKWLKFLGWYISEGSLYKSKSGYLVRIYQSNKKNRKVILNLLKSLGLKPFECSRSVDFQSKQIYEYLKNECGKGTYEKCIPPWILELDKKYLSIILGSLMKGDGSVSKQKNRNAKKYVYITTSKKLMSNIVELVLKLGWNCNVNIQKGNCYYISIQKNHLDHIIYSNRKLYKDKQQLKEEHYKGFVYCPELKINNTVIIKRNGKISLNGNSFDIGFGSLSGMIERNHNVCYVCYDNEGYQNTGAQRSGATTKFASTTTTPYGSKIHGKLEAKKPLPFIIAAHRLPYMATANIAYPEDLYKKVRKALSVKGPSYIQLFTPCTLGWKFSPALTVNIARLAVETNFSPLYEVDKGILSVNVKVENRKPVQEYLRLQGRFKNLASEEIAILQGDVDKEFDFLKSIEGKKLFP